MVEPPARDVTGWPVASLEVGGSSSNAWLRDEEGETWLFKPNRRQKNGHEQGEDWAEVLARSVAELLGVPTAYVQVAERSDAGGVVRGALSKNIIRTGQRNVGWELQVGAVLLTGSPGFRLRRSDGSGRPAKDHAGHTVAAVCVALHDVDPPLTAPVTLSAAETFAGYLLLDALIGNQDRHEENWAVVVDPSGPLRLAPSFDHAASLGFLLTDERFAALLRQDGGVERYAARGTASKFEGRTTPLTVLATEALYSSGPHAATEWLGRLGDVTEASLALAVERVPRMSDPARSFCTSLLRTNRRRLLNVHR